MRSTLLAALAFLAGCTEYEVTPIPDALAELEATAEDAYDQALASNYAAVSEDASALEADWADYRGWALNDGARESDLVAMDEAIAGLLDAVADQTSLTDVELARAANSVSGPMDELFALYDEPVPSTVLALDYGGREVSLDAHEGDGTAALDDIATLDALWADVKPEVLDAGGDVEAADYEASLARQRELATAGDTAGLLTESNAGLELVDALEDVFTN